MANEVSMPKLGFDMAEGTLVNWVKAEGDAVKKGDVIAEIETDKATVEVECPFNGIVQKHLVATGSTVPVGTAIALIGEPGEKIQEAKPDQPKLSLKPEESKPDSVPSEPIASPSSTSTAEKWIKASPLARVLARENGVDLKDIKGSGPGGRIVRQDIEQHVSGFESPVSLQTTPRKGIDREIPLTKLRSAIAKRMTESKQNLPHFYVTHAFDVATLMKMRADINARKAEEEKISVNDFIVKAVGLALVDMPNINATLSGTNIKILSGVNVGVAVATDDGLLTIVCRDVEMKPIEVISVELKEMALRVRDGKVKPDDIEGSTFTISNLGMYDVEHFAAIINPPEAAILAVGSAQQVPVVEDGVVKPGWRMRATLSADHRLIDGAQAAKFLQVLAAYLEQPWRLM